MHTSLAEAILADPIVVLELCTLVITFGFVVKASCSPDFESGIESLPLGSSYEIARNAKLARSSKRPSLEQRLRTFFGVGTLISLPKASLNGQRALRKF